MIKQMGLMPSYFNCRGLCLLWLVGPFGWGHSTCKSVSIWLNTCYKLLQGYLLGNPGTDYKIDTNAVVPYLHGMGIISDELYEVIFHFTPLLILFDIRNIIKPYNL